MCMSFYAIWHAYLAYWSFFVGSVYLFSTPDIHFELIVLSRCVSSDQASVSFILDYIEA